jgi:hypothetical protein
MSPWCREKPTTSLFAPKRLPPALSTCDGRGQRIAEVTVSDGVSGDQPAVFHIGWGDYSTLWYEVVLGNAEPLGEGNRVLDACSA